MVGGNPLTDLVLVAVTAFQQPHRGKVGQKPGQLLHLGNIRLHPEYTLVRIETEGEKARRRFKSATRQSLAVIDRGHGMVVGNKTEQLTLFLISNHLLHHAEVIAQVQGARRLNTG